ncbi:hypothetical protein V6N13_066835 [Hibiscus sabdariffa]
MVDFSQLFSGISRPEGGSKLVDAAVSTVDNSAGVGNRVTDRLATKGRAQRGLAATFSELPADVRELVDAKRIQSESDRDDLAEEGAIPHDPGGGPDAL